ncbi:glycoprotein hormone beta-5-like [Asterias amurensis]|uniref:Glycoprotein hormone beta-5-type 3 n=1 Tax=Asterias rubens TaxID=7604 RepID=A0A0U2NCY9_ASTRU|nr:glycoprotein hormone beta-5-type precursor 3 [Asterias rubens]
MMATRRLTAVQNLAIFGFVVLVLSATLCTSQGLSCLPRQYIKYDAVKPGCRTQRITIYGCFGRCHTSEIPKLLPPYKESNHAMCSYGQTESRVILLDDCDPGVDPTFQYEDALSCACKKCEPWNTFCQGF